MGLVTQETFLFHDTIFNNIQFGRLGAAPEEIYEAAKAAYAALLTGTFPDPVEIALPKGERPGFALARHELSGDCAIARARQCA